MHTYDCIFWAGPLDISDILSVQYKIKSKSLSVSLSVYTSYGFLANSKPQKYVINKPNGIQYCK